MLAVVTLASPHQQSPAHVQPALARFYRRLSTMAALPVPVVSVAGGAADVQVHRCPFNHCCVLWKLRAGGDAAMSGPHFQSCGSLGMQVPKELTLLQNLVPDGWAFEGSTDQMPGIWATADHQVGVLQAGCVYAVLDAC